MIYLIINVKKELLQIVDIMMNQKYFQYKKHILEKV